MWSLVLAVALAQDDVASLVLPDAALVLRGPAVAAEPGDRRRVWDLARRQDFAVLLPADVLPVVCVKVQEVVYGDWLGDRACFYRSGALSLATEDLGGTGDTVVGKDAVWLLRETEVGAPVLHARDREAMQPVALLEEVRARVANTKGHGSLASPAVPNRPVGIDRQGIIDLLTIHELAAVGPLEKVLAFGTAAEKVAVIQIVGELGVLPLVDEVIDHLDDADKVVTDLDPIGRPVGTFAAEALYGLAPRLDGRVDKERPRDRFGFMPNGIDFDLRATAVEGEWTRWWAEYRETGPVR